jgi:pimeloyl-ACP methyl ester carboxylesterase
LARILFLPGAGGRASFWHPVGALLPETWEKAYFAWPGLGSQPPDPAIRGLDDLVDMVHARLDTPADLVAQSMGALVALKLAMRTPQKVRRLVLAATSGGLPADYGATDWRDDYRREFPNASSWIVDHQEDLSDQLPSIDIPTLVLSGSRDPISPPAVAERLVELLPNATLASIAGGAHDFAETHARETAEPIRQRLG